MHKYSEARALIAEQDAELNSFIGVLDPGSPADGPLAGVTVGVKDCFYDRGRTPTMGSNVHPPPRDSTATILERLRAAGADIVGYTNLHEWAIGGTSAVTATGPVRNPWDMTLTPGGSSGGSGAALAAGFVEAAIGTDTGGSIRIPAGCCGVVGLKPTQGRVPTDGYAGEGGPTDQIGPMARSVAATRSMFEVLVDERMDHVDAGSLRVAIARGPAFENLHAEVDVVYSRALETISSFASPIDIGIPDWDEYWWANAALFINYSATLVADALRDRPSDFQADGYRVLSWGLSLPDDLLARHRETRRRARAAWAEMFVDIDVLITPTLPALPPAIDDLKVRLPDDISEADRGFGRLCGPMNLAGVPCLSLPCGLAGELAVNLSVTAARGRDDLVLAFGEAYEDATDRAFTNRTTAPRGAGSSA